MAKINYYDGRKYVEVEVSEEVAKVYAEISQEEKRERWREDKRSLENSIDEMLELGEDIFDDSDIIEDFIDREELEKLQKAIALLLPSQQKLIRQIYFEGKKQIDICKERGLKKNCNK